MHIIKYLTISSIIILVFVTLIVSFYICTELDIKLDSLEASLKELEELKTSIKNELEIIKDNIENMLKKP